MARRNVPTPQKGWVYLASNPSLAGWVKIGATTKGVEQRMRSLEKCSFPTPFIVEAIYESDDIFLLERSIHKSLEIFRVSEGKEYFQLGPKPAKAIIDRMLDSGDVTTV